MSQRSSWWTSRFKEKKPELTTTSSNYFIWNRWSLFPGRMHTNTDLFVEYTSFLEKSMQKMEHEKGHLLNDDNNTWLKKLWHFLQTLIHPDIYIKENTTGLILKKKNWIYTCTVYTWQVFRIYMYTRILQSSTI